MEENAAIYEGGYSKVLGMIEDGRIKNSQAANAAIAEYKDAIHQLEQQATDLSDAHFKIMSSKDQVMADFARRTMILMLIVVIIASVVAVLTAQVIARGVSRPVEAMTTHLAEMAEPAFMGWSPFVGPLQAAVGAFCPTSAAGSPLGVPSGT